MMLRPIPPPTYVLPLTSGLHDAVKTYPHKSTLAYTHCDRLLLQRNRYWQLPLTSAYRFGPLWQIERVRLGYMYIYIYLPD